jgi:hypothetical protein
MPDRPPKGWFTRCVQGVRDSGSADNPAAVCGATWRDKSPAQKRAATKKAEGQMAKKGKHCRSVTKSGKPSKYGRYRQCKTKGAKHWGPPRRKSKK